MNGFSEIGFDRARRAAPPQATGALRHFGRDWPAFWRRLHTRRALLRLNERQLADIGLSRAEAEREARLPFWRL
ncbi:DUF1127 domain-containing protein [Pseudomonas sp. PL-6]